MRSFKTLALALVAPLAVSATALSLAAGVSGCFGSKVASPFDTMQTAPITLLRLQNFEPPQATTAAASTAAIPPQIQQWITAGAAMLPPGLIPPNLIPGAAATPVASTVPRFHNFPILGTAQVLDNKVHDEIIDILGHESNFVNPTTNCMYAEFGMGIAQPNGTNAEILISLSCGQVQAFNMAWPYTKTGLSPDTVKRIVAVFQKSFPG